MTPTQPSGLPFDRKLVGHRSSGPKRALVREVEGQLLWDPLHPTQQRTQDGVWISPPVGAIWVPPSVAHKTHLLGPFFRFQLTPEFSPSLPARACVVPVTAALREAMLATVRAGEQGHDASDWLGAFVRGLRDSGLRALRDPFPLQENTAVLARCSLLEEPPPRTRAGWTRLVDNHPRALLWAPRNGEPRAARDTNQSNPCAA